MSEVTRLTLRSGDLELSGILRIPRELEFIYVLGHGAGAGMEHADMSAIAESLAARNIATLRYNFPYMERGGGPPDRKSVLLRTVRDVVAAAVQIAEGIPLFAGGKSMGGRMTSLAQSESPLPGIRGMIFYGFPLHPSGQPSTERAEHLSSVAIPMLFFQGTKDTLAERNMLTEVVRRLPKAELIEIEGADHSFHVPKRSGRTKVGILEELASQAYGWMQKSIL